MRVMLLMPIHKTMNSSCVISLVDFIQDMYHSGHYIKMIFTNGFNAAQARKSLSKHSAENGQEYDYILWLDSDHLYKKKDFLALVKRMEEKNIDMLSACYKMHSCTETAHGIVENDVFRHFKEEELKDDIIKCSVVGFGFLVMKPSVVKKLWDKHGDNLFVLDTKNNTTEDVQFCQCHIDDGGEIFFDPKVRVGHLESAVRY